MSMKISINSFNNNPKKYRQFFKRNGYLVIAEILKKKDFVNIEKLILATASKYTKIKKKKINSLNEKNFNNKLIE